MKRDRIKVSDDISVSNFIEQLKHSWNERFKTKVLIIGWQDGEYFKELCDENGGAKGNSLALFAKLPLSTASFKYEEIESIIRPYCEEICLGSSNGKYKFIYDFYAWQGNELWIYNPFLQKLFQKRLGLFQKLFGYFTDSPWVDHDLILENGD